MRQSHLPLLYQIILDRIQKNATNGEIEVKEIRYILNYIFRVGKENLYSILNEMKSLGIIDYKDKETVILKTLRKE